MKVQFSKDFAKALERVPEKVRKSVVSVINKVIDCSTIFEIPNCKKIESFNSVYRIRIGDYRAFFVLHIQIEGDTVKFEYLVSRGEAYNKKNLNKLRNKDA